MNKKTKSILAIGGVLGIGAGAGIGAMIPFVISGQKTKQIDKNIVDDTLEDAIEADTEIEAEEDFEEIFIDEIGSRESADSIANYIFNNKNKVDFSTKSRIESGVIKTLIIAKFKDQNNPTPLTGSSWEVDKINEIKGHFGITLELIGNKTYSVKKIGENVPEEIVELKDKGQILLYKSLFNLEDNLKKEEIINSITKDHELLPNQVDNNTFLKNPLLFPNEIQDYIAISLINQGPELFTFSVDEVEAKGEVGITFSFLNLNHTFDVSGFNTDTSLTPTEAVTYWEKKFDYLKVKQYVVNPFSESGATTLELMNSILSDPIDLPTNEDHIEIKLENISKSVTKQTIQATIISTKNETIRIIKLFTLDGFVSQEDIDVRKEITPQILKTKMTTLIKDKYKINDLKEINAQKVIDDLKSEQKNISLEVIMSNNRVALVNLNPTIANKPRGWFKFNFEVLYDADNKNHINSLLTKDYFNNQEVQLDGFEISKTDQEKANIAKDSFNLINQPVYVENVDDQEVPSSSPASDLIKNAWDEVAKDKFEAQVGQPTFVYKYNNIEKGSVTYSITYSYGEYNISDDIEFVGYKTLGKVQNDRLAEYVERFKSAIPTTITLSSKTDLTTFEPTIASLNTLFKNFAQSQTIPEADFVLTSNFNSTTSFEDGTANIDVSWIYGSATANYSFSILGFNSQTDADNSDILSDFNQFENDQGEVILNAKYLTINDFEKNTYTTYNDINNLLEAGSKIPSIKGGVKRTYKVISKIGSPQLIIQIEISKGKGVKKIVICKINNFESQADHDSKFLSDSVNVYLENKYKPSGKSADSVNVHQGDQITIDELIVNKTKFKVDVNFIAIDKYKGEIKYNFSATATDLNVEVKNIEGIIDGFTENETPEHKRDYVQSQLDAISSPIDSGMPNTQPKDYTNEMAENLIEPLILSKHEGTIDYKKISEGDGEVTIEITYTIENLIAKRNVIVNNLKTDLQVQKEQYFQDILKIKTQFQSNTTLFVNDPNGINVVSSYKPFDSQAAVSLNITMPKDIQDVSLVYQHPEIRSDGDLSVSIQITKGQGEAIVSVIKNITIHVYGINEARLKRDNQNDVNNIDVNFLNGLFEKIVDKSRLTSYHINSTTPKLPNTTSGVMLVVTKWTINETNGTITWVVEASKGNADSKIISGIISGFPKLLKTPLASEIFDVEASSDGKTLSGGTSPSNTKIIDRGVIESGATRTTITLEANEGYLFAGENKTIKIKNVKVSQNKYSFKDAKIDKMNRIALYYKSFNPVTLTEGAPAVNQQIEDDWSFVLIDATTEIVNTINFEQLDTVYNNFKLKIRKYFDSVDKARKNSNEVKSIENALLSLKISDTKSPLNKTSSKMPFDKSIFINVGAKIEGHFPTEWYGAQAEYEVATTIQPSYRGKIHIYLTLGDAKIDFIMNIN